MSDKNNTLASVFGGTTSKVPNKQEMLSSIFGSQDNVQTIKPAQGERNPVYEKLKRKILKKSEPESPVYEAINNDKPVAVCTISRDWSEKMKKMLEDKLIKYTRIQKITSVMFIVAGEDAERMKRCYRELLFIFGYAPTMYPQEEFEQYCTNNRKKPVYITNLSDVEAESIRQEMIDRTSGLQYSMFRMNDGKWAFGVQSSDIINDDASENASVCLMESYLKSIILLNGPDASYYKDTTLQNMITDKIISLGFLGLTDKYPEIYLYDSSLPTQILRIFKGKYRRVKVKNKNGEITFTESKDMPFNSKTGKYFFRKDTMKMVKKDICFTKRDMEGKIKAWERGGKENINKEETLIRGKEKFARFIYQHFANENCIEDWFEDDDKQEVQFSKLAAEISTVLKDINAGRYPSGYTRQEADRLFALIKAYGLDTKEIAKTAGMIKQISIAKEISVDHPIEEDIDICNILDGITLELNKQNMELERGAF